jgi:hypothetical protein
VRIAIDIDSTLHHYWPELADSARRRFGVDLPYERQRTWTIPELADDQLRAVIADTHSDAAIARAEPYPGAVETVNAWKAAGHYIHVTSHRATGSRAATERWLDEIGLRHDDLHCSYDKLARCLELGIDVIVDDSPDTLVRALDEGIQAATLAHPWNRELCDADERVVCAPDWPTLAAELERRCSLTRRAA